MRTILTACAIAVALSAGQASAITVTKGTIDGWGVTPFSNDPVPGGIYSVTGNNYSPINYPGVGHQPSPGGAEGELFDLEYLYVKATGNHVNLLLVASSLYAVPIDGTTYRLGDLLIDKGNNGSFDYGMVTQHANGGLTAGDVYQIGSLLGLQQIPGSYYQYPDVVAQVGGWGVGGGTLLGAGSLTTTSYDYGIVGGVNENHTYIYDYTFDLPYSLAGNDTAFQLAWGCGNDVIRLDVNIPAEITPNPAPLPAGVPEPATAGLTLLGLAAMAMGLRRRRQ